MILGIIAEGMGSTNVHAFSAVATDIVIFHINEAKSNAKIIIYLFSSVSRYAISGASIILTLCCASFRDVGIYSGMRRLVPSEETLGLDGVLADKYQSFVQGILAILDSIMTIK